jgi:rhamnogalacturonyl hydrolase YesR
MAITDVMAFSPDTHPEYETVLDVYNKVMAGLMARQGEDGLWHQVLDHPESYTETSCSGMFTFSLLRGFNKGWLPPEAREAGLNGWAGLQTKLTEDNQLKDVCPATGMNPSLKHYLERPRVTHDLHGIGPYLLSAGEVLKLKN